MADLSLRAEKLISNQAIFWQNIRVVSIWENLIFKRQSRSHVGWYSRCMGQRHRSLIAITRQDGKAFGKIKTNSILSLLRSPETR